MTHGRRSHIHTTPVTTVVTKRGKRAMAQLQRVERWGLWFVGILMPGHRAAVAAPPGT